MSAGGPASLVGRVVSFDEAVGLGEVEVDGAGSARFGFHCTQIADGSRSIPVGAEVTFSLMPGRLGRWEAAGVALVQPVR